MYKVNFYQDENGNEPVREYLDKLEEKSVRSKNARIKYNKIDQYIGILTEFGTTAGEPYMKHIDGEIWELRPLRDRILFFGCDGDSFVLLSHFMKTTQKIPKREIDKAKRLMSDYIERRRQDG